MKKPKICPRCKKEFFFDGKLYQRKYCSFKCSNAHHDFAEMARERWRKRSDDKITLQKRMRQIAKIGGISSAKKQKEKNRSQGELYLGNLLEQDGFKIQRNVWNIVKGYEIDIFIPKLKLALSFNGSVHYFPIYGETRLKQIQRRDAYRKRKLKEMDIKYIIFKDLKKFNPDNLKRRYVFLKKQVLN